MTAGLRMAQSLLMASNVRVGTSPAGGSVALVDGKAVPYHLSQLGTWGYQERVPTTLSVLSVQYDRNHVVDPERKTWGEENPLVGRQSCQPVRIIQETSSNSTLARAISHDVLRCLVDF